VGGREGEREGSAGAAEAVSIEEFTDGGGASDRGVATVGDTETESNLEAEGELVHQRVHQRHSHWYPRGHQRGIRFPGGRPCPPGEAEWGKGKGKAGGVTAEKKETQPRGVSVIESVSARPATAEAGARPKSRGLFRGLLQGGRRRGGHPGCTSTSQG